MFEKFKVAIVGTGPWSRVYQKNIERHQKLIIVYQTTSCVENFFARHLHAIESSKPDIIILATNPAAQILYLSALNKHSGKIILEKPLCTNNSQFTAFKEIFLKCSNKIFVNFPNVFNVEFAEFRAKFMYSRKKVKEVRIFEQGNGPFRKRISPLFDWYPHVSSILASLDIKFDNIQTHSKINDEGIQYIFSANTKMGFMVSCSFGNGFKEKNRRIEVEYLNSETEIISLMGQQNYALTPMTKFLNTVISKLNDNQYKVYPSELSDEDFILNCASQPLLIDRFYNKKNL
jgi:hypothetical protein